MVRCGVFFSADLQNLTDLQPTSGISSPAFDYFIKLQCGSCGELSEKDLAVCFDQEMNAERKPHIIKKCHFCQRVGIVTVVRGREPLTGKEEMSVQLMSLDCNGFEPIKFVFGRGWKVMNLASGTIYDIDLSSGDFCDYDVKGKCPVAILEAHATIKVLTPEVKKTGFKSRTA